MIRSLAGGIVLASITLTGFAGSAGAPDNAHVLPMAFTLLSEGPADACAGKCRALIAASGMITADTPRQFLAFARENPGTDATVVLESDGGSVLGALELGRAIRRLGFSTTVGRVIERRTKGGAKLGEINPRVDCQSMCTFVLLGGVKRSVPPDARVLVHQIWFGDRREDAVAASYTAEDLVVVQRDIGSIVQYTMEMGGDIELVQLSLKAPPWEPMRVLSRDELQRTRLDFAEDTVEKPWSPRQRPGRSRRTAGARSQRARLVVRGRSGHPALSRVHPLTLDGERIGSFQLELRLWGRRRQLHADLQGRPLWAGRPRSAAQHRPRRADHGGAGPGPQIASSDRQLQRGELESIASIAVPTRMIRHFAGDGPASMCCRRRAPAVRRPNPGRQCGLRQGFHGLKWTCQGQWAHVDRPAGRLERNAGLKP